MHAELPTAVPTDSSPATVLPAGRPLDTGRPAVAASAPSLGARRAGFVLLVLLLSAVAAAKAVLFDTMDPDCFWHLKVAEQLLSDGIGPIVDRLSFASLQSAWTPYSWLAELAMKAVWDAGGYRLAVATQAAMQAGFVILIAWACLKARPALPPRTRYLPPVDPRERNGTGRRSSYLSSAVAAAGAGFVSLPYLSFRPVTAALLLLAVGVGLIVRDRARGERTRAVWLCPLLAAVAVNLHLYAALLPILFAALLVGAVWERFAVAEPAERVEADRRAGRCFLLSAATAVGCACTPMLPGLVATAVHYTAADPMVAGGHLAEMRPFYTGTLGTASAGVAGFGLVLILARFNRFRVGERLMLAVAVLLLSQWGRFSTVFAMIAAPMVAVATAGLCDHALGRRPVRLALAVVLAATCARVGSSFPTAGVPLSAWLNRHGLDAPGYPSAAAEYVSANVAPRSGRLITEFAWGGYLEWAVGDRYQLFLDGRTQLFSPEFWRATYLAGAADRERFLGQVEADAAVLPAGQSVFRHALVKAGWRSAWRDDRSEVLLPPARPAVAAKSAATKPWTLGSLLPE
ncbi:MAG: hypothetical protein JWO31_1087 [Phycisphaerales bacterium]|nr:hypothetical protein [Phycisphaerales bacterium]